MAKAAGPVDALEAEISVLEKFLKDLNPAYLDDLSPVSPLIPFVEGLLLIRNGDIANPKLTEYINTLKKLDPSLSNRLNLRQTLLEYSNGQRDITNIPIILENYLPSPGYYNRPEALYQKAEAGTHPSVVDCSQIFKFDPQDIHSFRKLSAEGIRSLDPAQVSDEIFRELQDNWFQDICRHPNFLARMIQWREKQTHKNEINYQRFLISELQTLKQVYPNDQEIDAAILYKTYVTKVESLDKENRTDTYNLLKDFQSAVQHLPDLYKPIRVIIQNQIVSLLMGLGNYDQEEFIRYLSLLDNSEFGYCQLKRTNVKRSPTIDRLKNLFKIYHINNHNEIINHYLTEFLGNQETLSPYDQYLATEFLTQIQAKAIMYKTGSIEHIQNTNLQRNLDSWINEISLEPETSNPPEFDRDAPVKFSYVLKNVQEVTIRIFEVNTLSYYKNKQYEIKTDINLDGLVPQFEQIHQISSNPAQKVVKEFEFPELEGKVGTFIIDFYGHGRHSRSIIRKGSLKYVSKLTAAGQLIAILDENQQIVKSEGAGVILQGSFYKVKEQGFAQLPFARNQGKKPLIITDGEISNIYNNFMHFAENYSLRASILAHTESFVYGHKAKIAVKPQLLINETPAPIKLLQDSSITVTLNSLKQSSTKKFEDIQFEATGEYYTVYVEVPKQLIKVTITLNCSVKPVSTQENKTLSVTHQVYIDAKIEQGDKLIDDLYLNLNDGNSFIEVRGRNGELVPFIEVKVQIQHLHFEEYSTQILSTDREGRVYLGDLSLIRSIVATANRRKQVWQLTYYLPNDAKPQSLDLCLGDEFRIPYNPDKDSVVLLQYAQEKIENMNNYLTFDEANQLILISSDLPVGKYIL